MRSIKLAGLVLGTFLIMSMPAEARGGFRRGGIVVRPAIGRWGWYDPFFYAPYGWYGWYGYNVPAPAYYANFSELKLKTNVKNADVYINGAYAGKASKLKSMRLRPDSYNLEVRAPGYKPFSQHIYLLQGKTMEVVADLIPAPNS